MKTVVAIVIILLIVVGGGYALVKHNNSNKTPSPAYTSSSNTKTNNSTSSSSGRSSSNSATAASSVTINNFAFSPASLTVKKGTTVTWTNKDSVAHTVVESDNQTGPSSDSLATGKAYSFAYNTVGTFKYHCSIHPDMTGTVTVTQ